MRAPRQTKWLDQFLAVRLAGAGDAARRELERTLRRGRLSLNAVYVLAAVSDVPGISPSAAADRVGLHRSAVSRLVFELIEDNLLDPPRPGLDRRGLELYATPGIENWLAGAEGDLRQVERQLDRRLTPLRRKQLTACLEALRGPHSPVWDALEGVI